MSLSEPATKAEWNEIDFWTKPITTPAWNSGLESMLRSVGWVSVPRKIRGGHNFIKSPGNKAWRAKATLACYTELMSTILMLYTYNFVASLHLFTAYYGKKNSLSSFAFWGCCWWSIVQFLVQNLFSLAFFFYLVEDWNEKYALQCVQQQLFSFSNSQMTPSN